MRDNANQVDNLVDDLMKLSQLDQQEIHYKQVEPTKLVKDVLEIFTEEIKKRKIKTNIKELPACRADETLLKVVFQNLISNAVKFTSKTKKPEITIGYQPGQTSDKVIFYVKDNGVGFNMNDEDKAFETLQRLHGKEDFLGTGIGLAMAKKIIKRHGGEIWADASEKQGATFYFDLFRSGE